MPAMSRCRYTSWAEPRRARYQPSRANLRLIGPVLVSTNAATRWTTNGNRHRRAPAGTGLRARTPNCSQTASVHRQRYYGDSSGVTPAGSRRPGWLGRVVVSCTGHPTRDHVRARLVARPAGEHVGPGWRAQQLDIFARRRRRSPVPREHGDGPGGESSGDRATGEGPAPPPSRRTLRDSAGRALCRPSPAGSAVERRPTCRQSAATGAESWFPQLACFRAQVLHAPREPARGAGLSSGAPLR